MEGKVLWKTTFGGIQHLMEEDHWWKINFDGSQTFMRQPLIEDKL